MKKELDAASILQTLTEIRASIPGIEQLPARSTSDSDLAIDGTPPRDLEEFEYAAVAEALESVASDLAAVLELAAEDATRKALEIYYTAEELARDPAHADLIPHVEQMRRAYEKDFGRPIPPKGPGRHGAG